MKYALIAIIALSIGACEQQPYVNHSDVPMSGIISKLPKSTDKTLCGLYNFPYEHEPLFCGTNPWTNKGVCCTWMTEEENEECLTSWCVNTYLCEWLVNQRSCNPIAHSKNN